ncbi:coiled-coil domain-containing protein 50 isoform X3 [Clupea harengus]|uniref:Coiled-coil domain-containing protein 50 isoform X3 n=1 Tax=Clupea harengus TaxID=7950 RepID=A0A8M1KMD0_CLUHA|nr:coiled-coil domain-containing protein 50 isoform X3 [Clupea harengus]
MYRENKERTREDRKNTVCECFAVLEDGALAHNLQEQEIEHFYNSNVQKSQLVQHDVRIARRLQDEEEQRMHLSRDRRRLEEQDFEYAQRIQDEMQRHAEEACRREEEDEEMAKRLQEEEELQIRRQKAEAGCQEDTPLSEGLISLQLEVLQQVQRDAELAQRLQEEDEEEEVDRQPQRRRRQSAVSPQCPQEAPDVDFRAAQVAQDEEIAHYMQRHERKTNRRPSDHAERQSRSPEQSEAREAPERKVGALQLPRERLNSEGLNSPGEEGSPERELSPPSYTMLQTQPIHNIAEELDPTFKARKRDSLLMGNTAPSGICLANRTPHSVFYDYLPEPAFIPPTKRQSDRPGRPKAKEKRENCKQQ